MSKVFRVTRAAFLFTVLISIHSNADETSHVHHQTPQSTKSGAADSRISSGDGAMAGMGAMHAKMMAQMHGQGHAMMGGCSGHSPPSADRRK